MNNQIFESYMRNEMYRSMTLEQYEVWIQEQEEKFEQEEKIERLTKEINQLKHQVYRLEKLLNRGY